MNIQNDYLHVPRVFLNNLLADLEGEPATSKDEIDSRALSIRMLKLILQRPLAHRPLYEPATATPPVIVPLDVERLVNRLNAAEKLLREAEPAVNPSARYVKAGSLGDRIGKFLVGLPMETKA